MRFHTFIFILVRIKRVFLIPS